MIDNIRYVDKIIGNMILKQSNLSRSHIVNAASIRGADLSKFITETVKLSYDLSDVAVIFETKTSDDESINISELDDDIIRESIALTIAVTIYGNQSLTLAKILKARFESEKARNDLLDEGIYLVEVSNSQTMNEFMNSTIWQRTDFEMKIAIEQSISMIDTMSDIDESEVNVAN